MQDQNDFDESYLNRKQASKFLEGMGFPTAPATLAKYVTIGGGPEYELFGRFPRYRPSRLRAWVRAKLSAPRRNTSEAA